MKIRLGFVSNSSSSSFLVAFPDYPYNRDKLKDMMFPDKKDNDIVSAYDASLTVAEVVDTVYNDMKQDYSCNATLGRIIDFFMWLTPDIEATEEQWNKPGETDEERNRRFLDHNVSLEKMAVERGYDWFDKHRDGYVFVFEYSDNRGSQGVVMEHGDVFRNLPHATRNQH